VAAAAKASPLPSVASASASTAASRTEWSLSQSLSISAGEREEAGEEEEEGAAAAARACCSCCLRATAAWSRAREALTVAFEGGEEVGAVVEGISRFDCELRFPFLSFEAAADAPGEACPLSEEPAGVEGSDDGAGAEEDEGAAGGQNAETPMPFPSPAGADAGAFEGVAERLRGKSARAISRKREKTRSCMRVTGESSS